MPATEIVGRVGWEGDRDEDGYRTYKLMHLIYSPDQFDGPAEGAENSVPSTAREFVGSGLNSDYYVYCRHDAKITPLYEPNEPGNYWTIEQTFSNKPLPKGQTCKDEDVEDPLLLPIKTSGSYRRDREEATRDAHGQPINNSAHEQIRGPQNEWDVSYPKIRVEMNVASTEAYVALLNSLQDCVNDEPMWGYGKRCVKLSNSDWVQQLSSLCIPYLKVTLDFEVNVKTWDRYLLDEGTKCLRGDWDRRPGVDGIPIPPALPNPTYKRYVVVQEDSGEPAPDDKKDLSNTNPRNFVRFKDWDGQSSRVILDGTGRPFDPENPHYRVEYAEPPDIAAGTATGTNYELDDIVSVEGPTPFQKPQFVVTEINELTGGIMAVALISGGVYTNAPTNPVNVVGGTGVDAQLNLEFTPENEAGKIFVQKYFSANFFPLGIPASVVQEVQPPFPPIESIPHPP